MERRMTKQRRMILDALSSSKSHPTAEAVYQMIEQAEGGVSLATVYRNLHLLAEEGIIKKVTTPHEADHFDAETGLHYHVICEQCGKVDDIPIPADEVLELSADGKAGYEITSHEVIFYGICKECRDKNNGGK